MALVGRTGAGKSSLVHLLGGLYAPWAGEVRVAGLDPRGLSEAQRRSVVGVVPQAVQLFAGTVWDNLTLDDPLRHAAAVERAAQMAGLERLIAGAAPGLRHAVERRGTRRGVAALRRAAAAALAGAGAGLGSGGAAAGRGHGGGGQCQRGRVPRGAADGIRGDDGQQRAAITVAHRLSTARAADRVIVLDDGRIVEQGTPEELIRRGGRFAALVELEEAGWDWRGHA